MFEQLTLHLSSAGSEYRKMRIEISYLHGCWCRGALREIRSHFAVSGLCFGLDVTRFIKSQLRFLKIECSIQKATATRCGQENDISNGAHFPKDIRFTYTTLTKTPSLPNTMIATLLRRRASVQGYVSCFPAANVTLKQ